MRPVREPHAVFAKMVRVALVLLVVLLALWYLSFQARTMMEGPTVVLTRDPKVVHNTRSIPIEGVARNITLLTLNGRQIFTSEDGRFREMLVLENGYTIMTIYAKDRYGRTTTLVRSFVYTPASTIN